MSDRVPRFEPSPPDYDETAYGKTWAPYYDTIFNLVDDATIGLLAELAGDPPRALELAVGSGRIALPLSQRGVEVTGIDISEEMVALLRDKPHGDAVTVVMGDMAEVPVEGAFPLVYVAFNTIFGLLTQERQIRCFENVASHLEADGRFVVECFVPDLKRFDSSNTRIGAVSIGSDTEHAYEIAIHDPVAQRVTSHSVRRQQDGSTVVLPISIRYAWPAELDVMGRLAGLELEARWGWYDKRPFGATSGQHVSVYRKPA